jgi:preprotein translocase subunit SecG
MILIFLIFIILASVLLGAIVLIQNPKGGGLSGSIAGISNQFMGVKQTTDVLEKGTWILSGFLVTLCIVSTLVISSSKTTTNDALKNIPTNTPAMQQQALPTQPATLDTNKK